MYVADRWQAFHAMRRWLPLVLLGVAIITMTLVSAASGTPHRNKISPIRDARRRLLGEQEPGRGRLDYSQPLLEVMDNDDGTLSSFGTLLDFDSPVAAPLGGLAGQPPRDNARLGGRLLTYNLPQQGPDGSEGGPGDRNVELLPTRGRARPAAAEAPAGR